MRYGKNTQEIIRRLQIPEDRLFWAVFDVAEIILADSHLSKTSINYFLKSDLFWNWLLTIIDTYAEGFIIVFLNADFGLTSKEAYPNIKEQQDLFLSPIATVIANKEVMKNLRKSFKWLHRDMLANKHYQTVKK